MVCLDVPTPELRSGTVHHVDRLVLHVLGVYSVPMTIGDVATAARAIAGDLDYIGEGCARIAYVHDGIVYKVETAIGANYDEYTNAMAVRATVPFPFVVPDMSLHYVGTSCVLAMPFIDGNATGECLGDFLGIGCDCDNPCMPADIASKASAINGDSLSWGNTIYRDGLYYMIDFDAIDVA